jgi:glyoxylase-like metal-dependent hydrolase (beta-lactamase superfamily II)
MMGENADSNQNPREIEMSHKDQTTPEFQIAVIPVTPFEQNASLIWSTATREAAVVDPGGDMDRLLAAIDQQQLRVTAIWLTHGHIDHVGAATALQKKLSCPIIGPHRDDQFLLDAVEMQAEQYGIAEGLNVKPDRFLVEGDQISLAGIDFDVLHCPGHSPGHVVFYRREAKFAFVGDVLFHGSIGRTDLPGGDYDQLIRSITEKLWPLGNDTQFLPGHGPGSTFGQERQNNAFVSDRALGI